MKLLGVVHISKTLKSMNSRSGTVHNIQHQIFNEGSSRLCQTIFYNLIFARYCMTNGWRGCENQKFHVVLSLLIYLNILRSSINQEIFQYSRISSKHTWFRKFQFENTLFNRKSLHQHSSLLLFIEQIPIKQRKNFDV